MTDEENFSLSLGPDDGLESLYVYHPPTIGDDENGVYANPVSSYLLNF